MMKLYFPQVTLTKKASIWGPAIIRHLCSRRVTLPSVLCIAQHFRMRNTASGQSMDGATLKAAVSEALLDGEEPPHRRSLPVEGGTGLTGLSGAASGSGTGTGGGKPPVGPGFPRGAVRPACKPICSFVAVALRSCRDCCCRAHVACLNLCLCVSPQGRLLPTWPLVVAELRRVRGR